MGNVPGRPNVWVMGGDMVERGFGWPFFAADAQPAWRLWKVAARDWRVDDAVAEFDAVAALLLPADVVVLSFGESECADAWMKDRKVEDFAEYLKQLVGKVRAHEKTAGVPIVLVTPFPVRAEWLGRDAAKYALAGPDAGSAAFAEACRAVGKPAGIPVVDLHRWVVGAFGDQTGAALKSRELLPQNGYGTTPDSGALCGRYVAACFDRDGKRIWMCRIPAEYNDHTACMSPLLVDGKFIVEMGVKSGKRRSDGAFSRLIALDAATGKELWRSEPSYQISQTSSSVPMKATNGREDMYVIVTGCGTVVRVKDGKTLHRSWMLNSGNGTPTVAGADVYHASGFAYLTASRLTMLDRDTVGLRRLWARPLPCEFDGGIVYDKGLIYGPGGGQRPLGYVVFDAVNRGVARYETYRDVRQGIPPWVNGRQYVPAIAAGDYLFLGEHGTKFDGPGHAGAICIVMQKGSEGMLLARNRLERTWTGPPVFDGDRIYIRTDASLVCIGYTGDDGRAYEANENALYLLPELETLPPDESAPKEIAPVAVPFTRPPGVYAEKITYPMTTIGPFSLENSDAVLTAMGGAEKASVGICREPEKPQAAGVRLPIEVAGEKVEGSWHESCFYENHSTKRLRGLVGKGAFFTTVIANDRDRVVRVWAQQEPPDIWIAGRRVPEGTRVRLKRGTYSLLARTYNTREWPAPKGFYFRFEESSDVEAERKAWHRELRASKPELERIARHGTRPAHVEKAKRLLALAPE